MKKKMFLFFMLLSLFCLEAKPIKLRMNFGAGMYYPKASKFVIGNSLLNVQAGFDVLNLVDFWGIGGSSLLNFHSFDPTIKKLYRFDLYFHRFWNSSQEKSFFIYGFFSGLRQTNIVFEDEESLENKIYFSRPLIGFVFSSEIWGSRICWTQTENRKSKWETEFISKNSKGIIVILGWSFRGAIDRIKSEFYFNLGYEIFK